METQRKQTLEDWLVGVGIRFHCHRISDFLYYVVLIAKGSGYGEEFYTTGKPPTLISFLQERLYLGKSRESTTKSFEQFLENISAIKSQEFWDLNN